MPSLARWPTRCPPAADSNSGLLAKSGRDAFAPWDTKKRGEHRPKVARRGAAPAAAAPAGRSPTRRRYLAPTCVQAIAVGGPIAIGTGIGISIAPEIKKW